MIKNTIKLALTAMILISLSNGTGVTASQMEDKDYGTVNGEKITIEELKQVLGPQGISFDTLDKDMKKRIIDMVVDRKLLSQQASKAGLENTESYKKRLELLKKDLILTVWMEQEAKKIEESIKESDLKDYYNKNADRFKIPLELRARHILVEKEEDAKGIIKTLSEAKNVKEEFIKLAKEKSIGPSGKNGGDLGWFPLNRMVPEFSSAADKLKKGEFTKKPVKTPFGYHVIYLDDRKEASIQKFDDVKEQIKGILNKERFNKFIEDTLKKLKENAEIKIK